MKNHPTIHNNNKIQHPTTSVGCFKGRGLTEWVQPKLVRASARQKNAEVLCILARLPYTGGKLWN